MPTTPPLPHSTVFIDRDGEAHGAFTPGYVYTSADMHAYLEADRRSRAQLVGYVGSNRDILAPPQDRYEQPPEGTLLATPAEPAARAQGAEEAVVLWQYRWTNPGNYSHQSDDALAWKEVVPNTLQTMEDRVSELRGCKSDGKHCYEVRPLYTAPTLPQPAATAGKAEDELAVAIDMLARWCVAIDRNGTGWDDWDEHYKDAAYRPCRLREKLDAAMTKIKKEYE